MLNGDGIKDDQQRKTTTTIGLQLCTCRHTFLYISLSLPLLLLDHKENFSFYAFYEGNVVCSYHLWNHNLISDKRGKSRDCYMQKAF